MADEPMKLSQGTVLESLTGSEMVAMLNPKDGGGFENALATAQSIADLGGGGGGGDDSWKEAIITDESISLDSTAMGRIVAYVSDDSIEATLPDISTVSDGQFVRVRNLRSGAQPSTVTAFSGDTIVDASTQNPVDPVTVPPETEFVFGAHDMGMGFMWFAYNNAPVDKSMRFILPWQKDIRGSMNWKPHYCTMLGATQTIDVYESPTRYTIPIYNMTHSTLTFTANGWSPLSGDNTTTNAGFVLVEVNPNNITVYNANPGVAKVSDANSASLITLAASIDAIRDALIAAGQMKAS